MPSLIGAIKKNQCNSSKKSAIIIKIILNQRSKLVKSSFKIGEIPKINDIQLSPLAALKLY